MFGRRVIKTEEPKPVKADLEIVRPKLVAKPAPKAEEMSVVEEEEFVEEVPEIEQAEEEPIDFAKLKKELAEKNKQPVNLEVAPFAQILSGELIEGGLHRYVVISNKALGTIGEVLPID